MDEILDRASRYACQFLDAAGLQSMKRQFCSAFSDDTTARVILIALIGLGLWVAVVGLGKFIGVQQER